MQQVLDVPEREREATLDWERSEWSVPVTGTAGKFVRFGQLPVSLIGGVRYWLKGAFGAPTTTGTTPGPFTHEFCSGC